MKPKNLPKPPPPTQKPPLATTKTSFQPKTIIWPAGANVGVIAGQWTRLPDGRIQATYYSRDELFWAITLSQWLKEFDSQEMVQGEMFPHQKNYYQME